MCVRGKNGFGMGSEAVGNKQGREKKGRKGKTQRREKSKELNDNYN